MIDLSPGDPYVAMGSSFAAGLGIRPREFGSPRRAGRSSANYAHLLAERLGLDLTDVSYSGVTAAQIVDGTPGRLAQVKALQPATKLVTITCGGNDVGLIGRLALASLPRPVRAIGPVSRGLAELGETTDSRFERLPETFDRLMEVVRQRAPDATVVLVDYLTLLPENGEVLVVPPLPADIAAWGRCTAKRLASETAAAANRAGCLVVAASAASRDHHAWAPEPWTNRFRLSRGSGALYHPNATGMRAVADMLTDALER